MSAPPLAATDLRQIEVHNPANGSLVGTVAVSTHDEVRAAVESARRAQDAWAARPVAERAAVLRDVRAKVLAHADEIVDVLVKEQGKPRHEALMHDVFPHLELLTYFANEAERILEPAPIPLRLLKHRGSYLHYVPRGVLGVISPWNFPFNLGFGGVAMGLVAGNAVVLKPSEYTPLHAELGRRIYLEGGVPPELFQVVQGYGDVGAALVQAGVDMVEFTGSVATGKKVAGMCAERLIPCTLELGGKAAALVLPDAPLPRTLDAVVWGGLANVGQVCASIERLLVHEAIHDRFVPALVEKVKALRQGDASTGAEVDVGPLNNERQLRIVEGLVDDAVRKGATVLCGGKRREGPGYFYEPTVLGGCTADMDIFSKETFGPVIPVMKLPDEGSMIREANRSHLGLLGYVFTKDVEHGRALAEQIRAGTVMINDVLAAQAMAETPWGGVKQSGLGHTHGDDGLRHMCEARHVNYPLLPWLPREQWWYPYRMGDLSLFKKALGLLYGRGLGRLWGKAA